MLFKEILYFSFWPLVSKEKKRVLWLSRYCLCLRHFLRGTVSQSSTVLPAVGRRSMIGAWYLRTTSLTPFSIAATQRRVKTIMWITPSQCGPNFYDDEGSIAILRGVVRCFLGTVPNFSYNAWYQGGQGEPNNKGGNQACLKMTFWMSGMWDDNYCDLKEARPLCQKF